MFLSCVSAKKNIYLLIILRCGFSDAFSFSFTFISLSLSLSLIQGNLDSCYCASDEKMPFISPHVLQSFFFSVMCTGFTLFVASLHELRDQRLCKIVLGLM